MNRRIRLLPIAIAIGAIAWFYFSLPTFINPETGRKSKVGLSESQEQTLGLQSFQEVLSQSQIIRSGMDYDLVVKVARRLIGVVDEGARSFQWKVALVQSDQQNAFCLTGGEIVVYTGILPVTQSEAGLATVLGHEIAHATSRHGTQRIFQQMPCRSRCRASEARLPIWRMAPAVRCWGHLGQVRNTECYCPSAGNTNLKLIRSA